MRLAWWGALCGTGASLGLLLVLSRAFLIGRPQPADRVLPYLRDLSHLPRRRYAGEPSTGPTAAFAGVFGPLLTSAGRTVERVLGGSASIAIRLRRAGLEITVQEFRIEQVLWGLVAFTVSGVVGLLEAMRNPSGSVGSLLLCFAAACAGVLLRENYLTSQARSRERRILTEFPAVAELLALAVAAGEGPVAALDRVVQRSGGELSRDLARVLGVIRTGEPVGVAFDRLAAETGLPLVARFAQGIAVAVERGTPLADVLHAQAADVREAGRRELIEAAARKEVAMMIPVVFLILPTTVLFAFYPGLVGLSLTAP
ncbi:MAG: type II secretion system F family protein [Nocardioides sp.]|jgi:tight adherence protein C